MNVLVKERPSRSPSAVRIASRVLVSLALFASGADHAAARDGALEVMLTGTIDPRCEFTQYDAREFDFSVRNTVRIDFTLYCNLAMSIHLTSKNGALLNERLADQVGREPEHGRVYDAALSLEKADFRRTTNSMEMRDGVTFDTDEHVVFETAGALEIELRESLENGHAGNYTDVIGITLSPSLATLN